MTQGIALCFLSQVWSERRNIFIILFRKYGADLTKGIFVAFLHFFCHIFRFFADTLLATYFHIFHVSCQRIHWNASFENLKIKIIRHRDSHNFNFLHWWSLALISEQFPTSQSVWRSWPRSPGKAVLSSSPSCSSCRPCRPPGCPSSRGGRGRPGRWWVRGSPAAR